MAVRIDKELAVKIGPLVTNPHAWESFSVLLEALHDKVKEKYIGATTAEELFKLQGEEATYKYLKELKKDAEQKVGK